jgi:hypothetical protein
MFAKRAIAKQCSWKLLASKVAPIPNNISGRECACSVKISCGVQEGYCHGMTVNSSCGQTSA